ncbi:MAG TPA: heme exporter protein CcmD [Rhodocyclaceae bacterium]|nr:heme exporter protein CcmD [Rhodocyclaceae bacterium]
MMHWNSFADFIAMGGYAGYVWGSFGVTALILVVEPMLARRAQRQTIARLKRQLRAEQRNSEA